MNENGNHSEALEDCTEGLRHKPNNPHLHNNNGNAFQGLGHYAKAVQEYKIAVEAAPGMGETCSNLDLAFREIGHLDVVV